jgi:HSP20 family protein
VRISSKTDAARSVRAAWRFPLEIDVAGSSAKLENGVLSLSLGKKIPESKVAQLPIQ